MIHQVLDHLQQMWTQNDFLNGGFVLMLIGSVVALLRNVPGQIYELGKRQLSVSVEIRDQEVIHWLDSLLGRDLARRRRLKVAAGSDRETHQRIPRFAPGVGRHLVRHRRKLLLFHREIEGGAEGVKPGNGGGVRDLADLLRQEVVTIHCLGRSNKPIERLLVDAARASADEERGKDGLAVFMNQHNYWEQLDVEGGFEKRSLDSVILPEGVVEDVSEDLADFLTPERRAWYMSRGVPYRRGYLLHGEPGGGKSSLVRALASEHGLRLYVLDLTASNLDDSRLARLMAMVPRGAAVLVEDVDCLSLARERDPANQQRRGDGDDKGSKVTLSGLLNALDGVIATEGRVLFMTTNHPDRVDEALFRPGRIDREIEIGTATEDQALRLFLRFFPSRESEAHVFASRVPGDASMAGLQEHLLRYSRSVDGGAEPASSMAALLAPLTPPRERRRIFSDTAG